MIKETQVDMFQAIIKQRMTYRRCGTGLGVAIGTVLALVLFKS